MKKATLFSFLLSIITCFSFAQYEYEASNENPYGLPNPDAPKQIKDYEAMLGECNCKSIQRNPDGSWKDSEDMLWKWKYILNGMAVQDESFKKGVYSGSIRQFIADSSKWYVHWFSSGSPSTKFPVWEGTKKENGNIVLYRDQKAPNGMEGYFRLTFYDINKKGYKWIGEWVDKAETIIYPTWKITCIRED